MFEQSYILRVNPAQSSCVPVCGGNKLSPLGIFNNILSFLAKIKDRIRDLRQGGDGVVNIKCIMNMVYTLQASFYHRKRTFIHKPLVLNIFL